MRMQSSNMALSDSVLSKWGMNDPTGAISRPAATMTIGGTAMKTLSLLGIAGGTAGVVWTMAASLPLMAVTFGGVIIGLVLGLVMAFKPNLARYLAFPYAFAQGGFLGGISLLYAGGVGAQGGVGAGIVIWAVLITFGVFGTMLLAYTSRVIRATPGLVKFIVGGLGAIMIVLIGSLVLRMFMDIPTLGELGPLGIGIAAAVCVFAALSFIVDFKIIEDLSAQGAPKHMEWYGAFAILASLIFLYIWVLRLLSLLRGND